MTYTITRNYEGYNGGLLSPDCQRFYVNISKNASSYMADILSRQGWTAATYNSADCRWREITEVLIVLRDPVDRWCSGIAQYLITRILNSVGYQTYFDIEEKYTPEDWPLSASAFLTSYNRLIERFIFDKLDRLDDHVWPQHEFFQDIMPTVPRRYIVLDKYFEQNLQAADILIFPDADHNSSTEYTDQVILKDFFRDKLQTRPDLMKLVKATYARDYELIQHV